MSKISFLYRSPLIAAAASAIAAAGLLAGAAPAQAIPDVPLAPGNCRVFGFAENMGIKVGDGSEIRFDRATNSIARGPATLVKGITIPGTILGRMDGPRRMDVTFTPNPPPGLGLDPTPVRFAGDVADDAKARGGVNSGATWETTAFACIQERRGPNVDFEIIEGGVSAEIFDQSGLDSQCEYRSDLYIRTFVLKANSEVELRFVPAIPSLLRGRPVTITCDNGYKTETTVLI